MKDLIRDFLREKAHQFEITLLLEMISRRYEINEMNHRRLEAMDSHVGDLYNDLLEAGFNNLFQVTYPSLKFREACVENFLRSSQYRQRKKWQSVIAHEPVVPSDLSAYYNSFQGLPYCGFLKLHNDAWVAARVEQFQWAGSNLGLKSRGSYLEVGGATGLLPMIALHYGYENVVNNEISVLASGIAERTARILGLDLENLQSLVAKGRENFDVISCHQVIEHYLAPEELISQIRSMISPKGVIFFSHGYHLPNHPGHLPLMKPSAVEGFLCNQGLKVVEVLPKGTWVLAKG